MFVYSVVPTVATFLTTSGTANTELPNMALRQAVRNVDVQSFYVCGRGAGLTSISGIAFRVRRWTTAGSGGTAITPQARRIGQPAASTTAASSESAITAGTVSGAYQLAFGCGAAGPGGWVAPNPDSMLTLEAGSADEFNVNSISSTISLNLELSSGIRGAVGNSRYL
jgi:hypothetical protein